MGSAIGGLFRFGLLTGSTIIVAFLADILLAPALMALVVRPQQASEAAPATTLEVTR